MASKTTLHGSTEVQLMVMWQERHSSAKFGELNLLHKFVNGIPLFWRSMLCDSQEVNRSTSNNVQNVKSIANDRSYRRSDRKLLKTIGRRYTWSMKTERRICESSIISLDSVRKQRGWKTKTDLNSPPSLNLTRKRHAHYAPSAQPCQIISLPECTNSSMFSS